MQATETLWNRTADTLPPENIVVRTISDGGTESMLKRIGRCWFIPDGSIYVYYTPKFWKFQDAEQ